MNRLTRRDCDGDPFLTPCDYKEMLERLAAYEDTGLEPETCAEHAKAEAEGRYIMLKEPERDGVHRLQEIAQADIEGRLIVLPCKVGDTVYLIGTNPEYEAKIIGLGVERSGNVWFEWAQYVENVDDPDELWDEGTFYIDDIGKTVYLKREEAEKALKEAQE